jgi:predicted ribosome quality control (RQC) complex YloA/Tae2 family protein
LEGLLIPSVVSECFSQSKQELVIRLETASKPFFIKASLGAELSCLSFPDTFHRAKKNSVDLFNDLIGQRVEAIRQYENERSFSLKLTNNLALLFKMHGNRSNVILLQGENPTELFRKNLPGDESIIINELDRKIDWSHESFITHHENPEKIYFTFGKLVWQYLNEKGFNETTPEEKWKMIQDVKTELEKKQFYIAEVRQSPELSMVKTGKILKEHGDPIAAINDFYYTFTQVFAFAKEKQKIQSALLAQLQSSKNYYKKTSAKLHDLEQDNNYKIWADLLMANMHAITSGADKITLNNFYNNDQVVEIKLKKDLSPQKNAELFYRKSKNQKIETAHLRKALSQKENEISITEAQLAELQHTNDLKTLRQLKSFNTLQATQDKADAPLPYHEFIFNGFKIWVGKNAQSNDILTQKFGYKEDLWLHAKDVAGSHVLIKHQAGKPFPKDVIERAAQLAAYNSKRKNESLCPVIVTPKKFVRKRKGDPAGMVVVEKETVIMVEPKLN